MQGFTPKELVHLYQAELKARKKKTEESMVDLGRDVANLVRLAYPTPDAATREVIGINSFLEALPGPASKMKLHVIKGRPRTVQEAAAQATEVDMIEPESWKTSWRRGGVRMVEPADEELLKEDLVQTRKELKEAQREVKPKRSGPQLLEEITCYGCGEKGHYRRSCS